VHKSDIVTAFTLRPCNRPFFHIHLVFSSDIPADSSLLGVSSSVSEISRFHGDVDEVFDLQGCCAAYVCSSLPMFRNSLLSSLQGNELDCLNLEMGPIGCPETSVNNCDKERCGALVNAAMNLQVPQNAENVLTSGGPVSFLGRNLSMELVGLLFGYLVTWLFPLKLQAVCTPHKCKNDTPISMKG